MKKARNILKSNSTIPSLEAQVLLTHRLQKSKAWILAHLDERLTDREAILLDEDLSLLASGFPLPYLTGIQEFYGLDFHVTQDVLIPRPETEIIVEQVHHILNTRSNKQILLDVGTGSGCIPISLAVLHPDCSILATDISMKALRVARINALNHRVVQRVHFIRSYLFPPVLQRYNIISANLPYIPTDKLSDLAVSKYEPRSALDGGKDGLDYIRELLASLPDLLTADGLAFFEIEENQEDSVITEAQYFFPKNRLTILNDLAGKPRVLKIDPYEN